MARFRFCKLARSRFALSSLLQTGSISLRSILASANWLDLASLYPRFYKLARSRFALSSLLQTGSIPLRSILALKERWSRVLPRSAAQFRSAPFRSRASPYEKRQGKSCLRASTTHLFPCLFSHCSLPTWTLYHTSPP